MIIMDYSTLVLFGQETPKSLEREDTFRSVCEQVASMLGRSGCSLICRGQINRQWPPSAGPKPRGGKVAPKLIQRWSQAAKNGLGSFEIFDDRWSEFSPPAAYGAIGTYSSVRTTTPGVGEGGAENYVVVAVRDSVLPEAFGRLKELGRNLVHEFSVLYGFLERDIGWDTPDPKLPGFSANMIDVGFHDAVRAHAKAGECLSRVVSRVYVGNIVRESHLSVVVDAIRCDVFNPPEQWGDHIYLETRGDPGADPLVMEAARRFFHLIDG